MTVTLGKVVVLLLLLQSGEIPRLFSAERGWRRSGDRALLNRGDPGSADLGRDIARFAAGLTESEAPGLKT